MTPTKKNYEALGRQLMQVLGRAFPEARIGEGNSWEYQRLNLASAFNVRFQEWGNKPYYIILWVKNRYLLELDLSRIVERNERFTWYLNRPTHPANQLILSKSLPWKEEIPSEYVTSVREIKTRLSAGKVVPKAGYRLCERSGRKTMESKFVEILERAIVTHLNRRAQSASEATVYDFDDPEAIEGYGQDRVITTYGRIGRWLNSVRSATKTLARHAGSTYWSTANLLSSAITSTLCLKTAFACLQWTNSFACVLHVTASLTREAIRFPSVRSER